MGEDPSFVPNVTADFDIVDSGAVLQITLTNNSPAEFAIGQVWTALTWDITDTSVTLSPDSALIAAGSTLVGHNAGSYSGLTDLSGEWAFKSDIVAGSLGPFGVSSVGDVLFGTDTFGPPDRFNTSQNPFPPSSGSPNGISGGIVGPNITDFNGGGFSNHGPMVQSQMVLRLFVDSGTLTMDEITNVQPLFGTDGAPPIPEPGAMLLFAAGGSIVGFSIRKGQRAKS